MHITDFLKKYHLIIAGFLITCIYAGTLIYVLNSGPLLTRDSMEYISAAENLKNQGIFYAGNLTEPVNPALYSRRPPGYPILILLSRLFSNSNFSTVIFQILLIILDVILLNRILLQLNVKSSHRKLIIFIYLVYPSQIIYIFSIMSEILLQTLLLLSLFFMLQFLTGRNWRYLLFYNITISLAVLTKPVLLYFWIPSTLFQIWLAVRYHRKSILIYPLLMILTITFWSYRNYNITGYYHFSSIKNFNLLYYNTYSFLVNRYGEDHAEKFMDRVDAENRGKSFKTANRNIEKACFYVLWKNLPAYSFYHFRGSILFFIDPGRYDLYHFLRIKQEQGFWYFISHDGILGILKGVKKIPTTVIFYLLVMVIFNLLFLISVILFIIRRGYSMEFWLFLLTVILYFALITGPLGASRHRLPVFPELLLAVPSALIYIRNRFNFSGWN
jgi:hypothetical protein